MSLEQKKPRLEWLDALRGFTMILVVANHVAGMAFVQTRLQSSSLPFLLLFRMPLFFFISGFLAYKSGLLWSGSQLWQLTSKKLRVQIIPTVVFFLLAMVVLKPNFLTGLQEALASPMKGGYWFTLCLLYMFLVYYACCYLGQRLLRRFSWLRSWHLLALAFIVSLAVYETCYLPRHFVWGFGRRNGGSPFLDATTLIQLMRYMPFFLFGNIVRRYWEQAQRLFDSRWFYPLLITVVIFAAFDCLKWHTLRMEWANLPHTLARFGLPLICFLYFRHYQQYFTKLSVIGVSLQYIGRRTLDIYLLHFLFLPNLPEVGSFFDQHRHNFVIDTTASVLIALVVIAFCIITSNILRVSPLLKKWLFGRG